MNYPIWELQGFGGPVLIALIAIPHVYIAHLAVGGGFFLWITDWLGWRTDDRQLHGYVHRHLRFFKLLTMVFGGVTGVGIWFVIALVHPSATSTLIHAFVFGWAIEWVFFVGEIAALLIFYHYFDRLERPQRLLLGFLYALFAWLSLFVINGILSFMLSPGAWLETGSFWDGFLNPTFLPSLLFRTFISFMFAGLFGFVTAVYQQDEAFRARLITWCSKWLYLPVFGLVPSGIWYWYSIPAPQSQILAANPAVGPYLHAFVVSSVLVYLLGALLSLRAAPVLQKPVAFALVVVGLAWMGAFEYTREIARKPDIIAGYMYSNGVRHADVPRLQEEGVLSHAKWVSTRQVSPATRHAAGRELFALQCLSCHTVGGHNDILRRTATFTSRGMVAALTGQGRLSTHMPPFVGTEVEKQALAAYITEVLHGVEPAEVKPYRPDRVTQSLPPFDATSDDYVLLVWNDLGMHCISDSDPWFVILPPANTLEAQLVKRGPKPRVVGDEAVLTYRVEEGFEHPEREVPFWKYSERIFGAALEPGIGLAGKGLAGELDYHADNRSFAAHLIPVVPYREDDTYNPYPLFTVEARDRASGELLASTLVVAPTSTEMGCRTCHGGGWRWGDKSGIAEETAVNILHLHDELNGTALLTAARAGQPRLCQSCHADPALGAPGDRQRLNFSAALHGFHANYIDSRDGSACMLCHPATPGGQTQCLRGVHAQLGHDCTNCHGTLQEHALSLLRHEEARGSASALMANLVPRDVPDAAAIRPRQPWLNEPDCLNCHVRFQQPEPGASGLNGWVSSPEQLFRMRTDNMGMRCEACHGATHALYPARNIYHPDRDNLQPLQYGGRPYPVGSSSCGTCHTQSMSCPAHHPNLARPFRNAARVADDADQL